MKKIFITIFILMLISLNSFTQVFSDDFNGINNIQNGVIRDFYNDGDSVLYIVGALSYVNDVEINRIFSWNGDTIKTYENNNSLSSGVECVIKYNDTLFVGGGFFNYRDPSKDHLIFWDGESWNGFETGQPSSTVWDFRKFDNKLWMCGEFSYVGGNPCNKVAYYENGSWHSAGYFGMWANALEVFNGELFAGGYWGVRRYLGGTDWETFAIRPNGYVNELMVDTFNTFLYVGGQFTRVGQELSGSAAMWDGFQWHALGDFNGATVWPHAMAIYRGDLYIGGGLVEDGDDITGFYITRWDGEKWDSIGGGFDSSIVAMTVFQDEIYMGTTSRTYDGFRNKGMRKLYMPDNGCNYIKPRINTFADTFHLEDGEAEVHFYNNNPYVDSWNWDFGDGNISMEKDPVHIYTEEGEYTVSVTVTHNECIKSWTKTITVDDLTGIKEYENLDFEIYPNPSEANFTVKVDFLNYKNTELRINGLNGHLKTIIPVDSNEILINTDYWKTGIYLCSLFIDGKLVRTEKLILN